MTQEQLKELETLNERWANETPPPPADLPHDVMDLLPDVLAHIKELSLDRNGCEYAMIELRRRCGLDTTKIDLMEVWEHIKQLTTERDAALKAYAEMREALQAILAALTTPEMMIRLGGEPTEDLKHALKKTTRALSEDCGRDYVPKPELDAANAKCAEMRQLLERWGDSCEMRQSASVFWSESFDRKWLAKVDHALSTSCGKGYHADSEWKPVVTALAQTLEHLNIMLDIDGRPLDSNDRDVINDAQAALAHAERITGGAQ